MLQKLDISSDTSVREARRAIGDRVVSLHPGHNASVLGHPLIQELIMKCLEYLLEA